MQPDQQHRVPAMGPLWRESCVAREVLPHRPSVPTVPSLFAPFLQRRHREANEMPSATPQELAAAIIECIDAGARVISLSLALSQPSCKGERELEEAFNQTARRGVIVVAAAGNHGSVGSSAITRHPWVIPVVAYDLQRPAHGSIESGKFDWPARTGGARRSNHEPGTPMVTRLRWAGPAPLRPLLRARSRCCGQYFYERPRRR